jgi:hypothetical protein
MPSCDQSLRHKIAKLPFHFHTTDHDHAQDYLNRSCAITTTITSTRQPFAFALSHIRALDTLIIIIDAHHFFTSRSAGDDTTFLFPIHGYYNLTSEQKSLDFDHSVNGCILTGTSKRKFNLYHGHIINLNIKHQVIETALDHFGHELPVQKLLNSLRIDPQISGMDAIRGDVEFFIREYSDAQFDRLDRCVYDEMCQNVLANSIARFLIHKAQRQKKSILDQKIFYRAIDYMHAHFSTIKTLSDITRALHISLLALEQSFLYY